jgi:predicted SprT family Zn-dependent metalloprotease
MAQIDLFSTLAVPLPDETELARRYDAFNKRYFRSSLPPVTIRWSGRMRIAGTCDSRRRIITLSRVYHSHFPGDVDDTLKHEMIHLRHHRHDARFHREAERIGASVHCRDYAELHPRARLIYVCPNCGTEFPRSKRERLYCGRCARRRIDPRYQLVLRSHAAHERAVRNLAAKSPTRRRTSNRRRRRSAAEFTRRLL